MHTRVFTFAILAVSTLATSGPAFARSSESVEQLIARAQSARPGERPGLYLQIARQQADSADKLYETGNTEAGNSALSDAVAYSEKARDAATLSGKKLKDVEIALRKMSEKFRDVKHTLPFDDQAPVQQAIDRLETMRTDLLSAMFGKKGKKEKDK